MQSSDKIILGKILNVIDDIESDSAGLSKKLFMDAGVVKRACGMSLIQIGELSRHFSDGFVNANAGIPVKKMKGLRNAVAHGYESLDFEVVWSTIKTDVLDLKIKIKKLLENS